MEHLSEERTIESARNGDQQAFGLIYRNHFPRILATVVRCVADRADAEDLVQITFLRAFQCLDGFRGDASFSTWLTRIAMNACRSHHQWLSAQKRRVDVAAVAHWTASAADDPEQQLYLNECRRQVIGLIHSLPVRYQRAMHMRYVQDRTYSEIRSVLNIPMGTVKTWLWRGRQILMDRVGPDPGQAARTGGRRDIRSGVSPDPNPPPC